MNIVFFGSSKFVIPIIKILRENFDLKLVITTEKPKTNLAFQGDALESYPAIKYCIENKIPYLSVSSLFNPNLKSLILNLKSPIAILADFGLIIPQEILNAFPKGIINVHPSLLPKYRGPTPVQTAILEGVKATGVSIIKLDEEIDHGPILGLEEEKILPTDTSESLYKRLFAKGAELLLKTLPDYLNDKLKPTAQNHKKATFTPHLTRQDGFIDMSKIKDKISKIELERKIRAYFPWPGVWTKLNLKTKDQRPKTIKFLPGNLIQVEGKKPMSYKDFINGYPQVKQQLEKLPEQPALTAF